MSRFVIDTNVPIVANGRSDVGETKPSLECRLAVIYFLEQVLSRGKVLLDVEGAIQAEYHRYLNPRGQPGVGDRFYLQIIASSPERIERHSLQKNSDGEYIDLPTSLIEAGFDPSDRKFAALAKQQTAKIANAVDSDWLQHRQVITECGIEVCFLCGCDATHWFERNQGPR